jgi:hypothetical protein
MSSRLVRADEPVVARRAEPPLRVVHPQRLVVDREVLPAAAALAGLGLVVVVRGMRREAVGGTHQMGRRATVSRKRITSPTVTSKPETTVPRWTVCTA